MKSDALTAPLIDKSTNVRSFISVDMRTAAFQIMGWLAPTMAARSAARLFLTPPPPRPLSARARALFASADDRFKVKLATAFGTTAETSSVSVALWGRGPAVYMLHGWGGRGMQWVSFVEPLVQAGFTAVVLDAPGHGDSPAPRTSMLHFAAALTAVVDSLGPAKSVIGHSFGGAASVLAMKRGLGSESAVLIGTPADPAQFFEVFLGRIGIPEQIRPAIRSHIEHEYGFNWADLAVALPSNETDGAARLPALIVHDAGDAEVDYANADRIATEWPGAEVVTTHGLGHQRILRSGDVVRRVVDWLAGGATAGSRGVLR
jgi:pimeloyl-ACP methyl ester carboxylesterase